MSERSDNSPAFDRHNDGFTPAEHLVSKFFWCLIDIIDNLAECGAQISHGPFMNRTLRINVADSPRNIVVRSNITSTQRLEVIYDDGYKSFSTKYMIGVVDYRSLEYAAPTIVHNIIDFLLNWTGKTDKGSSHYHKSFYTKDISAYTYTHDRCTSYVYDAMLRRGEAESHAPKTEDYDEIGGYQKWNTWKDLFALSYYRGAMNLWTNCIRDAIMDVSHSGLVSDRGFDSNAKDRDHQYNYYFNHHARCEGNDTVDWKLEGEVQTKQDFTCFQRLDYCIGNKIKPYQLGNKSVPHIRFFEMSRITTYIFNTAFDIEIYRRTKADDGNTYTTGVLHIVMDDNGFSAYVVDIHFGHPTERFIVKNLSLAEMIEWVHDIVSEKTNFPESENTDNEEDDLIDVSDILADDSYQLA